MENIRRERARQVVHNSWDGQGADVQRESIRHFLGDAGGIESNGVGRQFACHCGCLNPPGGFCGNCHQVICRACYHRCEAPGCNKPLGPCCSVTSRTAEGQTIRLCRSCHAASRRRALLRLLLSPFILFEK